LAHVFAECKNFESAKREYEKAIGLCDQEIQKYKFHPYYIFHLDENELKFFNKYREIKAKAMNNLAYDVYAIEGMDSEYISKGLKPVKEAITILYELKENEDERGKLNLWLRDFHDTMA
jgi:hypothetical protein